MKRLLPCVLLAAAACTGGTAIETYRHPDGLFSIDVPRSWPVFTNLGVSAATPETFVIFVGEEKPRHQGNWLGATIGVHRYPRARSAVSGDDRAFEAYAKARLAPAEAMLADPPNWTSTTTVSGFPALTFVKDYEYRGKVRDRELRVPMRMLSTLVDHPAAYYVLEYRANTKAFPRHRAVYDKALRSFRIHEPAPPR